MKKHILIASGIVIGLLFGVAMLVMIAMFRHADAETTTIPTLSKERREAIHSQNVVNMLAAQRNQALDTIAGLNGEIATLNAEIAALKISCKPTKK